MACVRSWKKCLPIFGAGVFLVACTIDTSTKKKRTPVEPGADWWADGYGDVEQPLDPEKVNSNSNAFGAGARPSGNSSSGNTNTGPKKYCSGALAIGDLVIVEFMIASKSGAGDFGEWVEIRNARTCTLKLTGVTIESPRGSVADIAKVPDGFELAPGDTFLAAGSADASKNGNLPAPVFGWNASDVLKNDGDTIGIRYDGTTIDAVAYPNFTNLTPGRSLAFPSDCKSTDRASWSRWSLTFDTFGNFRGTPNAPNDDVVCF